MQPPTPAIQSQMDWFSSVLSDSPYQPVLVLSVTNQKFIPSIKPTPKAIGTKNSDIVALVLLSPKNEKDVDDEARATHVAAIQTAAAKAMAKQRMALR